MRFVPLVVLVVSVGAGGWLSADAVLGVRAAHLLTPSGESPEERVAALRRGFVDGAGTPIDPTIPEFLERLRVAAAAGGAVTAADLFDAVRLGGEVIDDGAGPRTDATAPGTETAAAVRDALRRGVAAGQLGRGWWAIHVRYVEPLPGGSEVVVYARHATAAGSVPVRWWLTKRGGEWKAYDLEDARLGLRLSHQLAGLSATGSDTEQVDAALSALAEATRLLMEGDPVRADEAIRPARSAPLPVGHRTVLALTEAAVALALGRPEEALARADDADQFRPGVPGTDLVRAAAHGRLGRWADAAAHARRFTNRLGPDPQASLILGRALLELGRPGEAADALRPAVAEFPDDARLTAALNRAASR